MPSTKTPASPEEPFHGQQHDHGSEYPDVVPELLQTRRSRIALRRGKERRKARKVTGGKVTAAAGARDTPQHVLVEARIGHLEIRRAHERPLFRAAENVRPLPRLGHHPV